jgi:hypothetical protein
MRAPGTDRFTLAPGSPALPRGKLFRKYVALFVAVVCVALIANGAFEIGFSYQEHKSSLVRIQREQAEAAAAKLGQFIKEIESQVGWTTQLPWSAGTIEQRPLRRAAPAAAGAGGHRALPARRVWQGAVARCRGLPWQSDHAADGRGL